MINLLEPRECHQKHYAHCEASSSPGDILFSEMASSTNLSNIFLIPTDSKSKK